MPLLDRLFGRKGGPPPLDLAAVEAALGDAVARAAGRPADPDLVRARLADRCRDVKLEPLLPEEFEALASALDGEAWGRLALLVDLLDVEGVRAVLPAVAGGSPLRDLVNTALFGLARETPLLTAELLRQAPLRVQELARRFVAALGAAVRGETAAVSRQRLERLDYGRLLAEAERAEQAAEGRMEELRRLQDEQEQRRPRRGKW